MLKLKVGNSFSSTTIILYMVLLYLISTLLQGLFAFSVNRVVIFVILGVVIINCTKPLTKRNLFLVGYLIFTFAYTLFVATEVSTNVKDWIYFASAVLLISFYSNRIIIDEMRLSIRKNEKIIKIVSYGCLMLTAISLPVGANYAINWGERYYIGFTRDPHAVASSLCLLMAMLLLVYKNEKFSIIRMIALVFVMAVIFMSGARTFIVPAVIICYMYIKDNVKNQWFKIVIYIAATFLMVYIFINSNMLEKFIWSSNAANQYVTDSLISMTGGRSAFWVIDIQAFLNQNVFYKLFGKGFDFPYITNKTYYNMHIWSHNDIIDILLSIGIVGTMVYCVVWKRFLKIFRSFIGSGMIYGMLLIYVLFPMLINGMFTYQHYLLSTIVFVFALIGSKDEIDNNCEDKV